MMNRKLLLILVFMMMVVIAKPATLVLGMEPSPPIEGEFIVGPEMWAVGVVDCSNSSTPFATIRVKKVEDCNVDTDSQAGVGTAYGISGCPVSEADILFSRLPAGSVFGLPCEAIITKVKNFKNEVSIVSFDCQVKFISDSDMDCSQ